MDNYTQPHLRVLQGPSPQSPHNLMARGLLYWIGACVVFVNASGNAGLAVAAVVFTSGAQDGALHAATAALSAWGAAVAVLFIHSPAALTLMAVTLGCNQLLNFAVGILRGDAVRTGIPLALALSSLAISIPLVVEQALKRRRWLQARLGTKG